MQVVRSQRELLAEFTAPERTFRFSQAAEAVAEKSDANLPQDPLNIRSCTIGAKTFQPRDWWEWLLGSPSSSSFSTWRCAASTSTASMGKIHRARAADDLLLARRGRVRTADDACQLLAAVTRSAPRNRLRRSRPELFKPAQPVVLPSRPASCESLRLHWTSRNPKSGNREQKPRAPPAACWRQASGRTEEGLESALPGRADD